MPDFPQDGSYLDRDADSLSRATDAMSVCYDLGPDSDVVRHAETLTAPGNLEQSPSGRRIMVDAPQPWMSGAALSSDLSVVAAGSVYGPWRDPQYIQTVQTGNFHISRSIGQSPADSSADGCSKHVKKHLKPFKCLELNCKFGAAERGGSRSIP